MTRFCPECSRRTEDHVRICPEDGSQTWALDPEDLRIGRCIDGRFTITERLGSGGMGTVYRARQHSMDRDVAIKLLLPERIADDDSVRRFFREARAASRLASPHAVSVYDFGQSPDGEVYLAMELMRGRTLTDVREGLDEPMDAARAVRLCDQVLAALAEAHGAGVLHRDLKPENVFVLDEPPDFVKVLDFGLAKLSEVDDPRLSGTGRTFGTPAFMSPEQAYGRPVDGRSDLYSLGLILFELVAGRLPFVEASSLAVLMKKVREPAPRVRFVAPRAKVPEALEEVLASLLAIDPEDRPPDANETRRRLRDAVGIPTDALSGVGPLPGGPRKAARPPALPPGLVGRTTDMLAAGLALAGDGWRLYGEALARCTSHPARELFRGLIQDQASLATLLRRTAGDMATGSPRWDATGAPLSQNLEVRFDELSATNEAAVRADTALPGTLDDALAFERRSLDFWERQQAWAAHTPVEPLVICRLHEFRNRVGVLAEVKLRTLGIARGARADSFYHRLAGHLPVRRIPSGTVLFHQGDPGDSMVVVVSGRFQLDVLSDRGTAASLTQIGPGDMLGEMSCLDPAPRSATVTAMVDSEVYDVDRGTLGALRDSAPPLYIAMVRAVIAQVTQRIRETDGRIERLFRELRCQHRTLPWDQLPLPGPRPEPRQDPRRPTRAGMFSAADLLALEASGRRRTVGPGGWICREGDDGQACYVVTEGVIEIVKLVEGGELVLASLAEGSIVGQMVLVDGGPRSASVRARDRVELVELARATFEALVEAHVPVALRFQEQLAVTGIRQLRLADRWLAALLDPAGGPSAPATAAPPAPPPRERTRYAPHAVDRIAPTPRPHAAGASPADRPTTPAGPRGAVPSPGALSELEASRHIETYMRTALREWGMSLEDLDGVQVVVTPGTSGDGPRGRRPRAD